MLYFHTVFSHLVDNSNIKIKTLAEQTGVDRASIYQYKSGKVLPTKEFVDKFISIMQLSVSEENDLKESYNIAQIGVSTYIKRKQLRRCLEILNDSVTDNYQTGYKPSTAQITLPDHTTGFNGREKVTMLVKNVIDYEFALANESNGEHNVNIKTFIPSGYNEFYHHLSELYHYHKNTVINFKPIISFTKSNSLEGNNIIDALSSIMYFIFTDCPGYDPRFYYDENNFLDSIGILYPYYIITTKHLILLDVNLTNSQIISDPYMIDIFRQKFESAYTNTKPLTKRFDKLIDVTDLFLSKTNSSANYWITCTAGSGGCIESFADEATISKYLNSNVEALDKILNYIISIKQNEVSSHYTKFISSEALLEFADTGVINQIQSVLKEKILPEDRKTLLTIAAKHRDKIGYVIDNTKIKIPPICILAVKNDCVILYVEIMSDMLMISEPEIANAFYDFFISLSEDESVIMSQEDVTKLLQNTIDICNKQIDGINS